jgi:hypothetical protein
VIARGGLETLLRSSGMSQSQTSPAGPGGEQYDSLARGCLPPLVGAIVFAVVLVAIAYMVYAR